jgi:type VI secretion system VasD/TssJ family lipoprotein
MDLIDVRRAPMMRALAMLSALVLTSCCSHPVRLSAEAVAPLNENDQKQSTPVDFRVYQLKDDFRFRQATLDQLWTQDRQTLDEDLVAVRQVTVYPDSGAARSMVIQLGVLPHSVRFIGVVANFRKASEQGTPKVLISAGEAADRVLRFTGYRVELQ